MKMLNVIGLGMSSVLCASLLVACADGRGTTGFKSYDYSKEERAQNKARYDALNKTPGSGDVGTGSSKPVEVLVADPGRGIDQPLFTPVVEAGAAGAGKDSAQPRVINEAGKPNPSAVPEMAAKVQDLNVTIEGELKEQNPTAKGLIKGITVLPNAFNLATAVTIQAVVVINGQEVYMDAANVPLKYLKADDRMSNMLFTLTNPCDQKTILVKDLMQAGVSCADANCQSVQMVLSFKTKGRPANAILILQAGKKDGKAVWQYKKTNIGEPMTFVQAQKPCEMTKTIAPTEGKTIPATENGKTIPATENASVLPPPSELTPTIGAPALTPTIEAPEAVQAVPPSETSATIPAPAAVHAENI